MTTTTAPTLAELQSDARRVYNCSANGLVELAEKYNVTTGDLNYARAHRDEKVFRTLGDQAFKTKSETRQMQNKLYATIKNEIRKAS